MNQPRCTDTDHMDFLVAPPRAVSCVEAARVHPRHPEAPAHDAFTRLLHRREPDPAALWQGVAPLVDRTEGILVGDDSTLDKPYAAQREFVTRPWSGTHHAVVGGMRLIRDGGWRWLRQLKANRRVNPERTGNRAVAACMIVERGTVVHLEGYGMLRVFRTVTPEGEREHWATNDEEMPEVARLRSAEDAWGIEVYQRALKQACGVEGAMVRAGRAQRNHIGCAIRAFVRLEWHRVRTGIRWGMAKEGILRRAGRSYLAHPWYTLPATASLL